MKRRSLAHAGLALAGLLGLAGCGSGDRQPAAEASTAAASPGPASPPATARPVAPAADITVPGLTLGRAVPAGSPWKRDGAQISDECLTYTSAAMPHTYAIVVGGRVERVSFAVGAPFRLPNGVGPGSSEADVRSAYPGLASEPHKYQDAPAKYLTTPGLRPDETGLRFEIGTDGTVEQFHIGLPSSLSLVEGCA